MQLCQRCSICEPNTWNQFSSLQTSNLSFGSSKIWPCNEISKETCSFRPLPPLALLSPTWEHAPVARGGKDTQLKRCWTVSEGSHSPHHFEVDLSFWDTFNTPVIEQQIVQRKSQQLPPKHPFQQLGMSCTGLQLAIPAFAHRDTYWKITQSVDSGLLWNAWKRAAHPFLKSRQKNHFEYRRHDGYLSICPLYSASTRVPIICMSASRTAWNHFHDNWWFMPLC